MKETVFSYADDSTPPVQRGIIRLLEAATGQRELRRIYLANRRDPVVGESFWQAAVRSLALDVRYDAEALGRIPKSGPVVVVANHPYGVLDGIVVSWLMQKVRADFLVLSHSALLKAPEVREFVLPVDFCGTAEAMVTNLRSRATARHHLQQGGCIVVFPAGAISTAPDRLGRKPAVDGRWQPFTAQLIQRAEATVVPICFEGQNSRLFQIASHLSPVLRLSLIFHEVRHRIGSTMRVAIGEPIAFWHLRHMRDRQLLADHLQAKAHALSESFPGPTGTPSARGHRGSARRSTVLAQIGAVRHKLRLRKPQFRSRVRNKRPFQPRPR